MTEKKPRYPKGDRRKDKGRLSLMESLADAWLHLVEGSRDNVFADPPRVRGGVPLPRMLGWCGDEKGSRVVALTLGSHLSWMLSRKRGFSWAEQYFTEQVKLLSGSASQVDVVLWDLHSPLPEQHLIEKLEQRLGFKFRQFGPAKRADIHAALLARVKEGAQSRGNRLIESWLWIEGIEIPDEGDSE